MREIALTDRAVIAPHLAGRGTFSEYCFPNIFLFRDVHAYRLVDGPWPVIRGVAYDGAAIAIPLFDITAAPREELRALAGQGCFCPVSEEQVAAFDPGRVTVTFNDADSDYIYQTERLAAFDGPVLKKKRALATRFIESAAPMARNFDNASLPDARAVLEAWFQDVEKPWADTDYAACAEALTHWQALGLFGLVCHAGDGEPAGFLLASQITPDMAAVHFAKGKRKFDGVFPYMFNQLAVRLAGRFAFLNFEQDLGKEGFRQSKRSYAPERLLRKYRLALR